MMQDSASMPRRQFLKLAGFAAAAAAVATTTGCTAKGSNAAGGRVSGYTEVNFTKDVDVLIVGAGIGGMMGAYAPAKAGLKTLIIDKMPTFGGASKMAAGVFSNLRGTNFEKDAGVYDFSTQEWFDKQFAPIAAKDRLPEYRKKVYFAQNEAADIIYSEFGVKWRVKKSVGVFNRCYLPPTGIGGMKGVLEPMNQGIVKVGGEFMYDMRAMSFIVDENNVAVGMRCQNQTTRENVDIKAKKFLLAAGGYIANQQMVSKYIPEYVNVGCIVADDTGDGITLGESIGGALDQMDFLINLNPNIAAIAVARIYGPAICVLPTGKRFGNEVDEHNTPTACRDAGFEAWWDIFDDQLMNGEESRAVKSAARTFPGAFVTAETVEELAEKMAVPEKNLVATFAEYATICATQKDDAWGKTDWLTLLKPPFYACRLHPVRYKTQGGLRISGKAEVVDASDNPIANLYATGEMVPNHTPNMAPTIGAGLYTGRMIVESLKA